MASGLHFVGTLTFLITINILFQIASSARINNAHDDDTESANDVLVGAPDAISFDDDVQLYASMGLQEVSRISEGPNELALVEIVSVTKKVVAGTLYEIQIRVGTSNCAKGTKENCQLLDDSETELYKIKAWSRPWLGEAGLKIEVEPIIKATEESNSGTKITRNRRSFGRLGAARSVSIDDKDVQNYASLGMQEVSKYFGGPNALALVEIASATVQVVAGDLYKIKINVGLTDCPQGTQENCQLLADSETQMYEISAWSRPWLGEAGLKIEVEPILNVTADE